MPARLTLEQIKARRLINLISDWLVDWAGFNVSTNTV